MSGFQSADNVAFLLLSAHFIIQFVTDGGIIMKRTISLLIAAAIFLSLACVPAGMAEGKLSVVATTFPIFDWTRQIIGDSDAIELTMLLDSGVDLHNFNPTVNDIRTVNQSDLFIYIGGESDAWVDDALRMGKNENRVVLCLMEALGESVKDEQIVEGMETEEEEEEEEGAGDEHIWLSLRNAQVLCRAIADELVKLDAANADLYQANAEAYIAQLSALDEQYAQMTAEAAYKTLLFCDRFPFRYLTDDYGLSYYAAFPGCSAAADISISTIRFLREKADELHLPAVVIIDGSDTRFAETILRESKDQNRKIVAVDSMQGTTSADVAEGKTYLDVMTKNLDAFREALN